MRWLVSRVMEERMIKTGISHCLSLSQSQDQRWFQFYLHLSVSVDTREIKVCVKTHKRRLITWLWPSAQTRRCSLISSLLISTLWRLLSRPEFVWEAKKWNLWDKLRNIGCIFWEEIHTDTEARLRAKVHTVYPILVVAHKANWIRELTTGSDC